MNDAPLGKGWVESFDLAQASEGKELIKSASWVHSAGKGMNILVFELVRGAVWPEPRR